MMMNVIERIKDPYERKARVIPGLLVALPLLVPLVAFFGMKNAVLTGVMTIVMGCGCVFALANVARGRGKELEEKLVKKWGGFPTTILLRHSDATFDKFTKERYHEIIRNKLGIPVPTALEEKSAPELADQAYIAATRKLRELTRGDTKLLLKENIAYGFHRNMTALKPFGIATCVMGFFYGVIGAGVLIPSEPYFVFSKIFEFQLPVILTWMISGALLAMWILYFKPASVWIVGCAYAERLFECLPNIQSPVKKVVRRKEAL